MITERIDAITRIPEPRRVPEPPAPRSVKIELTARCDLACFFCATQQKLRRTADLDFRLYLRIIQDLRRAGVEEVGLFYLGESFLYPRLVDAIAAARALGFPYIFLTTNGRRADYQTVRACVHAGLDSLKFSLNACNPEHYRSVTRVDAFDLVVGNIKAARRAIGNAGRKCGLYVSSILYDEDFRVRMAPVLAELRPYIDEHYWLPLYGQAGFTAGARGTKPVAGNTGRVGALRDSLPCWAVFTEGHITYDGFLSACCFDHDGRFHMGDLKRQQFLEAWNSPEFRELRRRHLERDVKGTVCEACIAYA